MLLIEKNCLCCLKKIHGRTDKKFCNNYCRSSFHNSISANRNNYVRKINYHLQRNRSILEALYLNNRSGKWITFSELFQKGFTTEYYTCQKTDERSGKLIYCYEYGYRLVRENAVQIIRRKAI